MQVQKRHNIIIKEVKPEICQYCDQLLSPIEVLSHNTICRDIQNKDQKKSDEKQEQLDQPINRDQKNVEQPNQINYQQKIQKQQQNQIKQIYVPNYVKQRNQVKSPYTQMKVPQFEERIIHQKIEEKRFQNDDLKIYQNDLNNKHNQNLQVPLEPNKQENEQDQEQILNQEAKKAYDYIKQRYNNKIEADQQQLDNQQQNKVQTQNNVIKQLPFNVQIIENKRQNQRNQYLLQSPYRQNLNSPFQGYGSVEKVQSKRQQEQLQFIKQNNQNNKIQQSEQKNHNMVQKDSKSQQGLAKNIVQVQQQQQQKRQAQNYQQQQQIIKNYEKSGRNRAISDFQVRKQFEYKPGMIVTDQQVNEMTPEEIYEYFTQLDLENQVGLKSKIIVLENKRVQINATDNCSICLDEIQPQKEAVDVKLDCNHQFHYDCIKKWLQKSKYCPVCKEYVSYQNNK